MKKAIEITLTIPELEKILANHFGEDEVNFQYVSFENSLDPREASYCIISYDIKDEKNEMS